MRPTCDASADDRSSAIPLLLAIFAALLVPSACTPSRAAPSMPPGTAPTAVEEPAVDRWTASRDDTALEPPPPLRAAEDPPVDVPLPDAAAAATADEVAGGIQTTILGQDAFASSARAGLRVIVEKERSILDVDPLPDADVWVALRIRGDLRTLYHGKTDGHGSADVSFRIPALPACEAELLVHVREKDGEGRATFLRPVRIAEAVRVLLSTDKPRYQPGQTIHVRALAMAGRDVGAKAGLALELVVEDAKGNRILRRGTTTSAQGVASADLPLADRVNLGTWRVQAVTADGEPLAEKTLTVERYVLPKFEVTMTPARTWYAPGDTVTGLIEARYFFGKPVARGAVTLAGSTFDVETLKLVEVTGATDDLGRTAFELHLPEVFFGSELAQGNADLLLEATVVDAAGHAETAHGSVVIATEPVVLLAMPESGRLVPGVENLLWIAAARPDGTPARGTVSLALEDGTLSAATDEAGIAVLRYRARRPGPEGYIGPWLAGETNVGVMLDVRFESTEGETVERRLLVDSTNGEGDQVLLRLDRAVARAGRSVQVDVISTRGGGTAYLDVVQKGQTLLTRTLELQLGKASLELPIPPETAGTLELHAYLLREDGEFTRDSRVLVVEPADELRIDIEQNREEFLPGERALLRFSVTDVAGRPKAAALGLLAVDEAVYALQEMRPGLEKVYFLLEQELLQPRVQLKFLPGGVGVEDVVKPRELDDGKQRAAMILLAQAEPEPRFDFADVAARRREEFREQVLPEIYAALERYMGLAGTRPLVRQDDPLHFRDDALDTLAAAGFLVDGHRVAPDGRTVGMADLEALDGGLDTHALASRAARWGVLHAYRLVEMWAELTAAWCPGERGQDGDALYCVPRDVLSRLEHTQAPGEDMRVGLAEPEALSDPWGNRYVVRVHEGGDGTSSPGEQLAGLSIFSKGPDGAADTADDIRWDAPLPDDEPAGEYGRYLAGAPDIAYWEAITERESGWSYLISDLVSGREERREERRARRWQRELEEECGSNRSCIYGFGLGDVGQMGHGYGTGDGVSFGRAGGRMGRGRSGQASGPDRFLPDQPPSLAAPRVREAFPETLFWQPELITDDQGKATAEIDLADSITSWRLGVVASSADGALGSRDHALRVFQPFFVDLDLPIALTQDDEVSVPVALYNYLDRPQQVSLELNEDPWFAAIDGTQRTVRLEPQQVTSTSFRVRAKQPGLHPFTVYAIGDRRSDAVRREVRVEPDGSPIEQTFSDRIAGEVAHTFSLPADSIPGSESLDVKIYAGPFAQAVENLDSLLAVPYGCFEQTSSVTYPNVLVLDYLKRTGRITPEVQMKAEQYVQLGYQRLLTFEVDGGGFQWFGEPPAHLVLTAYGLREFVDLAKVHSIDPEIITRTRSFLRARQRPDGSWTVEERECFNEGLQQQQASSIIITAYAAWALREAGESREWVERALEFLERHVAETSDPYGLAVMLHAFLEDRDGDRRERILEKLVARAHEDPEGGSYWAADGESAFGSRGVVGAIETTALAVLALLELDREPALVRRALDWLVRRKDPQGNWGSTQATILSLKALIEASLAAPWDERATVQVVVNGETRGTVEITPQNSDVLHVIDATPWLRPGENTVAITGPAGEQTGLMAQIVARSFVPWPAESPAPAADEPLELTVEYDRRETAIDDVIRAQVTLRYRLDRTADNAIIDLGIPPGFDPVVEDLERAVEQGVIARWELTDRQLILYVQRLEPESTLFLDYGLRARYPLRARTPASQAWLYYEPEIRTSVPPVEIVVVDGE